MGFARHVANRIAFLATGRIVEHGSADELFSRPASPECAAFLSRVLKY
jgi:polar amino acid transport system ATP-binding protein